MNAYIRSSSHAFLTSIELCQDEDQQAQPVPTAVADTQSSHADPAMRADDASQTHLVRPAIGRQQSTPETFPVPAPAPLLCPAQAQASIDFLLSISLSSPGGASQPTPQHSLPTLNIAAPQIPSEPFEPPSTASPSAHPQSSAAQSSAGAGGSAGVGGIGGVGGGDGGGRTHPASFSRSVHFLSSISLTASPPCRGPGAVAAEPAALARRQSFTPPPLARSFSTSGQPRPA